ncbi:MAG: ATP-binding cassette domain-containing protein [Epsilonproteobacteria bacterium]|nr:ATP-binding cassette domain-containing protein [Campylobacterota bacterium]
MEIVLGNQPLLEAEGISKSFDYQLFDNLSLSLYSKQSVSVMGRSGTGKSTLLHILSTLLKPDSGSVKILEEDVYSQKEKEIEIIRRKHIGIIFQSHYLFKGMSALENVESATLLAGTKIDKEIFEMLEIDNIMHKKVGEISGGQQQRVSIARVLNKKPKIIFADEPTGNLDRDTANLVMDALDIYIKENDAALFLVTHDQEIAKRTQKLYLLENKKLNIR